MGYRKDGEMAESKTGCECKCNGNMENRQKKRIKVLEVEVTGKWFDEECKEKRKELIEK